MKKAPSYMERFYSGVRSSVLGIFHSIVNADYDEVMIEHAVLALCLWYAGSSQLEATEDHGDVVEPQDNDAESSRREIHAAPCVSNPIRSRL